jgi:hypothetical protein
LHTSREHTSLQPDTGAFIVDDEFSAATIEGTFDKRLLDPADPPAGRSLAAATGVKIAGLDLPSSTIRCRRSVPRWRSRPKAIRSQQTRFAKEQDGR